MARSNRARSDTPSAQFAKCDRRDMTLIGSLQKNTGPAESRTGWSVYLRYGEANSLTV